MCGRPFWRKKNLLDWCSARSGADMGAAFDAAHTPQARMGVRGSGPNRFCVHPRFDARRIFWIGAARGRVLTCVRPLMRLTRRRPGWEFADQAQISPTRLKRLMVWTPPDGLSVPEWGC